MKEIWQGFFQKKHFGIRFVTVMLAVLGMGFSLSFLLLVDLGADPCTMMNRSHFDEIMDDFWKLAGC